jgi:hypothetical protein
MRLITKFKYLFRKPVGLIIRFLFFIQHIGSILSGIKSLRILYKTFKYSVFGYFILKIILLTIFNIDLANYLSSYVFVCYTFLSGFKYLVLRSMDILKDISISKPEIVDQEPKEPIKFEKTEWDALNKRTTEFKSKIGEILSTLEPDKEVKRFYLTDGYIEVNPDGSYTEVKTKTWLQYAYDYKGVILIVLAASGLVLCTIYYPDETSKTYKTILASITSWFTARSDDDSSTNSQNNKNSDSQVSNKSNDSIKLADETLKEKGKNLSRNSLNELDTIRKDLEHKNNSPTSSGYGTPTSSGTATPTPLSPVSPIMPGSFLEGGWGWKAMNDITNGRPLLDEFLRGAHDADVKNLESNIKLLEKYRAKIYENDHIIKAGLALVSDPQHLERVEKLNIMNTNHLKAIREAELRLINLLGK